MIVSLEDQLIGTMAQKEVEVDMELKTVMQALLASVNSMQDEYKGMKEMVDELSRKDKLREMGKQVVETLPTMGVRGDEPSRISRANDRYSHMVVQDTYSPNDTPQPRDPTHDLPRNEPPRDITPRHVKMSLFMHMRTMIMTHFTIWGTHGKGKLGVEVVDSGEVTKGEWSVKETTMTTGVMVDIGDIMMMIEG